MARLEDALDFLKDDLDKAERQWESTEQWKSLLQREEVTLEDLLDKFDPISDEASWTSEYNGDGNVAKLIQYRKRTAFLKASRKEFKEEYDPERTDCDFMRLLELPYTDPRYVIEFSKEEMKE